MPWRARRWRWATPAVAAACGALFIISAVNSHGTDLRPGRYVGVSGLVASEKQQADAYQRQAATLQDEINALTNAVPDAAVRAAQALREKAMPAAGLAKVNGPGLSISLADSPTSLVNTTRLDPNLFVIHQQDIQAVVNALWSGGATAITIQGQRIISTTGIKCSGSTVLLGGVPYPEPFVVQAVGDPTKLNAALAASRDVGFIVEAATSPDIQLGWSVRQTQVSAPAYTGITALSYATEPTP
ncbi:membrane protein [Nocardioides baekrokdamisoli]|uniref:Membrane protein n=2 Tax=Nocardioides baekrokdamisoli TaxID=1804624 RepID=A0A3G9IGA9_9ACTN|nr:membrane protein [Nocardioides baekrokdamisoli]